MPNPRVVTYTPLHRQGVTFHQAIVRGHLQVQPSGKRTVDLSFIVDSGAALTLISEMHLPSLGVDRAAVLAQLGHPGASSIPTGLLDAHGKAIAGVPVDVQVNIDNFVPITQQVWFCPGLNFNLLGQAGWFQNVRNIFLNFPNKKGKCTFVIAKR